MQVNMIEKECGGCGDVFVTSETDTSSYCSWVCK